MRSLHAALLVVAVLLFLYAGFLIDHGDWPGNASVLTDFGLAAGFAAFIPWAKER